MQTKCTLLIYASRILDIYRKLISPGLMQLRKGFLEGLNGVMAFMANG